MNPGDVIDGRFRIVAHAGEGGMGTVFRAADLTTAQPVAIKILDSAIDRERARREAHALRSLGASAPGSPIVRYIADGETADGRVFLVMEWLEGVTVAERILDPGFTLAEAVAVARQVATALGVAHAAGIVHRDVKPSNIMLVDGRVDAVRLIDFGVVRIATATSLTHTGTAMGTPGYMAPEQARGERTLTGAVDLFALGCVLYECISARPTFSGSAAAALLTKILLSEPTPLGALCPEAPPSVCTLVERLLAKDARRRPPSAAALIAALDALGPLPNSGLRRSSQDVLDAPTVRPAAPAAHCLVLSARGQPDDVLDPPAPAQHEQLVAAAATAGGACEVLTTGVVVAHFTGEQAAVHADAYAKAAREIVPEHVTVVSGVDEDVAQLAETGTLLLSRESLAAIFRK